MKPFNLKRKKYVHYVKNYLQVRKEKINKNGKKKISVFSALKIFLLKILIFLLLSNAVYLNVYFRRNHFKKIFFIFYVAVSIWP